MNHQPTIENYAEALRALPDNLTEADVTCAELRMYHDERIDVYFAPFPESNPAGRILLVGICPGRFQFFHAVKAASAALRAGVTPEEARQAANVGSFAGRCGRTWCGCWTASA